MSQPVIFREFDTDNGFKIGHATLNKAASLNALDLEMIRLLMPQLLMWQSDPGIVCVVLDGSGDKAFCAGGDVVAMHQAMVSSPDTCPHQIETFFSEEYTLDYLIHTYSKPFVVWGNGIVMGGGLGLMAGASHRIVTESSRIAMPEITIGLYPDVGGSWFLNQMPGGCGLFLGLTGASINASDACFVSLADHAISHSEQESFYAALRELPWQGQLTLDNRQLEDLCQSFAGRSESVMPTSNVESHFALINEATHRNHLEEVVAAIADIDSTDDKWLSRAQSTLAKGSPITAHLVWQQLRRGADMTLADCFRMELVMSCRCAAVGEFQEGVRALLIDKDNQPAWTYTSVGEVDAALIESFFTSPWQPAAHPLAALGDASVQGQ